MPRDRYLRHALKIVVAVAVSACGGGPGVSPEPSPASTPVADRIVVGSIARVVTSDLRVRSLPGVSDDSEMLEPLLQTGQEVFVTDGPVAASGYDWYQVAALARVGRPEENPFGWVAAAGKDGEPWLAGGAFACPPPPESYGSLVAMRPLIALACVGDAELSIAARLVSPEATCGLEIGWTIEPDWLGGTCEHPQFLIADPNVNDTSLHAALDPAIDVAGLHPGVEPADWLDVQVTGQFDHPAAETCIGVSQDEPVPLSPPAVVLACRTQFAVTKIEPAGYLP